MIGIQDRAPSAQLSPPGNGPQRGGPHGSDGTLPVESASRDVPPHTAPGELGPESRSLKRIMRTTTLRLKPTREQFRLLRLLDAQAAQYMNRHSIGRWAQAKGWRPPENARKDSLTKHEREDTGILSAAVYVGCERRVAQDWERSGKRIFSGVEMPRYGKGSIPIDSGARGKMGACGVAIRALSNARHVLDVQLTASEGKRGAGWRRIRIDTSSEREARRADLMARFASGEIEILSGQIRFADFGRKVLLTVAYALDIQVPSMGARHASLTEDADGRLLVRIERVGEREVVLDLSRKLYALKHLKEHWDGVRRRFSRRAMRSKGSARLLREKLAQTHFAEKSSERTHSWSKKIVRFCFANGVGEISVVLVGADWPARQLKDRLKYKAQEYGIEVIEATLAQESTGRAAKALATRRGRRAKKLGDAVREIHHQLGESHVNDQR